MLAEILTVACLLMMFWCVRLFLRAKDHFKAVNGIPMGKNENPANVTPEDSPSTETYVSPVTDKCQTTPGVTATQLTDTQLNDQMIKKGILTNPEEITNFITNHYKYDPNTNNYAVTDNLVKQPRVDIEMINDKKILITSVQLMSIINYFINDYRFTILPELNTNYKNTVLPELNNPNNLDKQMTPEQFILYCYGLGRQCEQSDGRCRLSSDNNTCIPLSGLIS